jgi:hypothetical protein
MEWAASLESGSSLLVAGEACEPDDSSADLP